MTKIPTTFRKNGFDFEQIERRGNLAVFRKHKKGKCVSYETVKITSHNGYQLAGVEIPAGECYPHSESWGTNGFTFNDVESAMAKMKKLEGLV